MILVYERLPELLLTAFERSTAPGFVALTQVLVSAAALLPATLFIGATFPCALVQCAPLSLET